MVEHLAVVNRRAQIFPSGSKMKRDQISLDTEKVEPGLPQFDSGWGDFRIGESLKMDNKGIEIAKVGLCWQKY